MNIKIFDTTLRDGEQSPGCSMTVSEKIHLAKKLEKLNVDAIEAGFAASSKGDFDSISEISRIVKNSQVASLARALKSDIDMSYNALKDGADPRINIFLATSPIHLKYKLKMTPDEVLHSAYESVKYAKTLINDVEFSLEDATRSDKDFLCKVIKTVIDAGALTVNIADTVGYMEPDEFMALINAVKAGVPNIDKAIISVHCHNDLGLATANSLAAVKAGAGQIECTVNGIGERAGNASLEEVVMGLKVRGDVYGINTSVITRNILSVSRTVSAITGSHVQPNKAVVGKNAFAHEAGIHQHGMMENRATYEIMSPTDVGYKETSIVLGKHSGRHAFSKWLEENGHMVTESEEKVLFSKFKKLCDKKKDVTDSDIEALLRNKYIAVEEKYKLSRFVINIGNTITSTAVLQIKSGSKLIEDVAIGDGPVDASFRAIDKISGLDTELEDYQIRSVTQGVDALGEAIVKLKIKNKNYKGRGLSTDVIEASILAYIAAVNKACADIEAEEQASKEEKEEVQPVK